MSIFCFHLELSADTNKTSKIYPFHSLRLKQILWAKFRPYAEALQFHLKKETCG